MNKLLIATRNQAKFNDFKRILARYNLELLSLADLNLPSIEETGKTFEENAELKVRHYAKLISLPVLADDGGLEIDVLNGWPGVYSRRIFGPDKPEATDQELINEALRRLEGVPEEKRTAHMTAAVALMISPDELHIAKFSVDGFITLKPSDILIPRFPFRSIFYLPKLGKVAAEVQKDTKNYDDYLNHRKNAIIKLEPYLKKLEKYVAQI